MTHTHKCESEEGSLFLFTEGPGQIGSRTGSPRTQASHICAFQRGGGQEEIQPLLFSLDESIVPRQDLFVYS